MAETTYANPFIVCDRCGNRAIGRDRTPRGSFNLPCRHEADFHSLCPSWSPVDGCTCVEHFGYRPHDEGMVVDA